MKKLLIVEQEAVILEILDHCFSANGWVTAGCSDGKKAMELMDSFQPDLMLTNILIPDYTGTGFCSSKGQIKSHCSSHAGTLDSNNAVKYLCFASSSARQLI